jgi:hypothetical protein
MRGQRPIGANWHADDEGLNNKPKGARENNPCLSAPIRVTLILRKMTTEHLQLVYTLLCDDVRIEMGNKISLMGIFQNIMVEKLPISLIKFAVVNHWRGEGNHHTEVRILAPNKTNMVVTSQPTQIELAPGGFTDNVSFFVNVVFPTAGTYWVQTLADAVLLEEFPLIVTDVGNMTAVQAAEEISETIN